MAQPESASNWRLKAGIAVLVLAMALPLSALLVPLLDLPMAQSALIGGALVAGAPEVLMLLAAALLGRQNFDRIVPSWMPAGDNRIVILAAADVAFILSIFVMGGEFWEKFRRLFVWEGKV